MTPLLQALVPMVVFILIFYVLIIRPQKKQEREVTEMRASVSVGDDIVTIGGIVGKVIKVKEDELIIEVGADKMKLNVKKWSLREIIKSTKANNEIK